MTIVKCADCKNTDVAETSWVQANDPTQFHHINDKVNREYYCPECNGGAVVYEEESCDYDGDCNYCDDTNCSNGECKGGA